MEVVGWLLKGGRILNGDHAHGSRSAVNVAGSGEDLDNGLAALTGDDGVAVDQILTSVGLGLDPVSTDLLDGGILGEVAQSRVDLLDNVLAVGGDAGQLHGGLDEVTSHGAEQVGIHGGSASSSGTGQSDVEAVGGLHSVGGNASVGNGSANDHASNGSGHNALQGHGAVSLAAGDGHATLDRQDLTGQGALSHHDVGGQGMHGVTIVAVDHSVVLEVLVGDQLLGGGDHHEVQTGVLRHVHAGDDVDTILGRSVDTEVVADLHAGDLSVIGEDPVDAVLQEAHQVGMAVADHDGVGSLQLGLQTGQDTLEVLAAVLHPVGDVVGEGLIGHSVEVTLHDQAVVVQEGHAHGTSVGLSIPGSIQEVTDLEVLELSQGTAHHIHVVGDDVDVLGNQSVSSILDGDGGIQARTRLGHGELDGLHTTDGGQGTIVPTVGDLTAQGDSSDVAILAQDGDLTGNEVDTAEQLILDNLDDVAVGIGALVLDVALHPLMGGDVGTDVHGHDGAVGQGNSADADILSQLHSGIILDNARNVGGVDQGQTAQIADSDGLLLDGGAGAGSGQAAGDSRIIEDVRNGVLGTILSAQEALLNGIVDDGRGGNLGHQDVLEHGGDPLLLDEEGVVGNDGRVAGNDGLDGGLLHGVILQLAQTVSVVVVETAVHALGIIEDGGAGDGLHNVVQELLTSHGAVHNLRHQVGDAGAALLIGFQNSGNLSLEAHRAIGRIIIASDLGFTHDGHVVNSGHESLPPFIAQQKWILKIYRVNQLLNVGVYRWFRAQHEIHR